MSKSAKAALSNAAEEAARQGDRRIGTNHLLLGLLHDSAIAGSLGVDVEHARATAQDLDRQALAGIGLNLAQLPGPIVRRVSGHAPLTSGLRAVIARAVDLAATERVRTAEPRHLMAALLERRKPDPAAELLEAMRPHRNSATPQ
nr:Clp protease N-terminal domain-containing protein [Microlunatus elymi]